MKGHYLEKDKRRQRVMTGVQRPQREMDGHLICYKHTLITHVNGLESKYWENSLEPWIRLFSIGGLSFFGEASVGFMFCYWG